MRLHANVYPEYFGLLDIKHVEFRQIESIVLENSKTHEKRIFAVTNIRKCEQISVEHVQKTFSLVPWDKHLPIFAIELGDEISVFPEDPAGKSLEDRKGYCSRYGDGPLGEHLVCSDKLKGLGSVHAADEISKTVPDRKEIAYEKPWYVVGD